MKEPVFRLFLNRGIMKTERLFDKDSFIFDFTANLISSQREGKLFAVVLDKTAFFPEGGGQGADKGVLNGEEVLDVKEKDGVIYHYLKREISGVVSGRIDREIRLSRMQNHTGEHILSGIIHSLTGADNISFSLSDEETTLAFNVVLDAELIKKAEAKANSAVFANLPIEAYYPDKQELEKTLYRSKLDLSENVRLVKIGDIDICACCAPHMKTTGQVGLIKVINYESYKGGTKLWINCGERALSHYEMLLSEAKDISHLLCAKIDRINTAVEKLKADKEKSEYELVSLKRKAIEEKISSVEKTQSDFIGVCEFKGDDLRLFAEGLKGKVSGIILALEGSDESGYRYVLTSAEKDITQIIKKANAALNGKGGGRDNMARGTYNSALKEINAFFKNLF